MINDKNEYIAQLKLRVARLENILKHLFVEQCKEIRIENCSVGNLTIGDNCNMSFYNSSIGIISTDFDDAEDKIDDLETRLED